MGNICSRLSRLERHQEPGKVIFIFHDSMGWYTDENREKHFPTLEAAEADHSENDALIIFDI